VERKVKIGLETHISPKTNSKLFSACPTHGDEPNTAVDPVSLGLPGSKPVLNELAVQHTLKVALALNCTINHRFFFSRKTYFYPDLAKNYQITQYETPVGKGGYLELASGKKITIERVHLEEDPAALVHSTGMHSSPYAMVDYNRSGMPLIEIVTAPDMASPQEAREFLDKLVLIISYLGLFDEKGGLIKADCNVSVTGGDRVEVKNVNGIRSAEKALAYEIKRQTEQLEQGKKVSLHTRSFDEKKAITLSLREKETENDYGYIFDPDLPLVELEEDYVEAIQQALPELPKSREHRFVKQYKLDEYTASVLASNFSLSNLFQEVVEKAHPQTTASFLTREMLAILNRSETSIEQANITPQKIVPLLHSLADKKVTEKNAKEAMIVYVEKGTPPMEYIKTNNLLKDMATGDTEKAIHDILKQNPQAIADYAKGEKKSLNFLLGQLMRLTKGKVDPATAQKMLEEKLKEYA
jgi:aspartyl-tRNA(Asn)/glutamyl-tRNA(Gln) amidotransferase subunit B